MCSNAIHRLYAAPNYSHQMYRMTKNLYAKAKQHDHGLPAMPSRPMCAPLSFPHYISHTIQSDCISMGQPQGPETNNANTQHIAPLLSEPLKEGNGSRDLLYQYVQNLCSIKSTHLQLAKVPSCRRFLDALFQEFGFNINSQLPIAYALVCLGAIP